VKLPFLLITARRNGPLFPGKREECNHFISFTYFSILETFSPGRQCMHLTSSSAMITRHGFSFDNCQGSRSVGCYDSISDRRQTSRRPPPLSLGNIRQQHRIQVGPCLACYHGRSVQNVDSFSPAFVFPSRPLCS